MVEKNKDKVVMVTLEPISIKELKIKLFGKTPLLMDRMSEETKLGILAKQTGISKSNKKKVRDTNKEVYDAIHTTGDGKIGFPAFGFKKGMMEATSFVGDKAFSKKLVSGVKILNVMDGLIPIKYKKQDVLQHNVGANTKFTPQFHNWECDLKIQYDSNNISAQDIITLLNYAGFYVGIGAWRPKGGKGGSGEYGMYEVKTK